MEKQEKKRFLCRIGVHEWEKMPVHESQNLGAELLFLFAFGGRKSEYKCKHCGKTK